MQKELHSGNLWKKPQKGCRHQIPSGVVRAGGLLLPAGSSLYSGATVIFSRYYPHHIVQIADKLICMLRKEFHLRKQDREFRQLSAISWYVSGNYWLYIKMGVTYLYANTRSYPRDFCFNSWLSPTRNIFAVCSGINVVIAPILTASHFATNFGGLCWPNDGMQFFSIFHLSQTHKYLRCWLCLFHPLMFTPTPPSSTSHSTSPMWPFQDSKLKDFVASRCTAVKCCYG